MIDLALGFLCAQMDNYLRMKLDPAVSGSFIQLDNIAWHDTQDTDTKDTSNAFISLVNVEEDRISKSPDNYARIANGSVIYKNPKIFLNLYLLFSVDLPRYDESLKQLSYIVQFFQYQNVFNRLTNPSLPAGIEELIFDLYTLSFQDLNNMWGIMGSKYLPSVLYKMRLITISEEFERGSGRLINEIMVNETTISQ